MARAAGPFQRRSLPPRHSLPQVGADFLVGGQNGRGALAFRQRRCRRARFGLPGRRKTVSGPPTFALSDKVPLFHEVPEAVLQSPHCHIAM